MTKSRRTEDYTNLDTFDGIYNARQYHFFSMASQYTSDVYGEPIPGAPIRHDPRDDLHFMEAAGRDSWTGRFSSFDGYGDEDYA